MVRDRNLAKRDLMAIPGGLLAFYGGIGLLYVLFWRSAAAPCSDSYRFLINGACYNAIPLLLVLFGLGVVLLLVGTLVFRGRPDGLEGLLHAGTPTHFFFALLVSLVAVPAILAMWLRGLEVSQGNLFVSEIAGVPVKTVFLLGALAFEAALVLLPYAILVGRQAARRRRFLSEARRVAAPAPGEERPATWAPAAVDEAGWPESR